MSRSQLIASQGQKAAVKGKFVEGYQGEASSGAAGKVQLV